jgi:hypothetical protein
MIPLVNNTFVNVAEPYVRSYSPSGRQDIPRRIWTPNIHCRFQISISVILYLSILLHWLITLYIGIYIYTIVCNAVS